jgi:N-acetylglutamate synthase-like GNAT family acetyltransferase
MTPGPDHPEGDLQISTDPADVDTTWLIPALTERSYWARGRGRSVVERSIAGSLVFSALLEGRQVGFARVVTDEATFAWICDVFVDETIRGHGVGKRLMAAVLADPRLQGLKRMLLATDTAASFYAEMGFETLEHPEKWMRRVAPAAAAAGQDDR